MVTYLQKHERLSAGDRRKQLIDVAIGLFSQKGFGGTTTKEIAKAAGVNEAIIFRHFATKQKLYEAILEYRTGTAQLEEGFAELQKLMKKRDDQGVVAWIVTCSICLFRIDPRFQRLMLFAALEGHEIAVMHHKQVTPFIDALRNYIAERQKDGALLDCSPELMIFAISGMPAHFAMVRYLFQVKEVNVSDAVAADVFTRILMKGLGIRKGKKK